MTGPVWSRTLGEMSVPLSLSPLRTLPVLLLVLIAAPSARAADGRPCGAAVSQPWSTEKVQPCPLTGGLPPNGWVPVYRQPVAVPARTAAPAPDGWLHGTADQFFVCDAQVPAASYTHPSGWRNDWWAYTQADGTDTWGWVPETFFAGGGDDEADAGLRRCPSSPAAAPSADPPPDDPSDPGDKGIGDDTPTDADPSCAPEPTVTDAAAVLARSRVAAVGKRRKAGTATRTLQVRYGTKAQVVGRLTDPAGAPMANAPLCVVSRPDLDDEAPYLELARTTTDADGKYTVDVPSGPSREILVVYRTPSAAVVGRPLVKVVPRLSAKPSKRTLRNGQTLRIRGRLSGGPFPRRGVLINLQAIRNGRWASFDDPVKTRPDGTYTFSHEFEFTSGTQTYSLRTRVVAQNGYPYVTGVSKAIKVRVRGPR
jgi:hypothetical protein